VVDTQGARLTRMLAVDGEVAEITLGDETVGWLGCHVIDVRPVEARWWRRGRDGSCWLGYDIEWTSPAHRRNGYGDDHGAAETPEEIDELLAEWETCTLWFGGRSFDLRWVSPDEAEWARRAFGWSHPWVLPERFGWDDEAGWEKVLAARPSAAIVRLSTPGSAQGAIGLRATRVDDDSLVLSRERRPADSPFGLWRPDSLDRLAEIDAERVTLFSTDEWGPTPLYELPPTVRSLTLRGAPVRPRSLRLERLPIEHLDVEWDQVDPASSLSPATRRLDVFDSAPASLADIPPSEKLEALDVGGARRWTSLAGLERFPHLRTLSISQGSRLRDLSALAAAPQLEALSLHGCRRVEDLARAQTCPVLKRLWIDDGDEIPSIAFLRHLPNLRSVGLTGSTNVVDGDLTPLLDLPALDQLAVARRRHYRPRVRELFERAGISYDTGWRPGVES
jgi:hypothetical protein